MIYQVKDNNFKEFVVKTKKEKKFVSSNIFSLELKNFFQKKNKYLLDDFKKKGNGLDTAKKRSDFLNQIIAKCFNNFFSKFNKKNFNFSIVATGGFGREELAPYSDVDILFLHNSKDKKFLKNFVKFILHNLWNLGFKVGYATRTVKECIFYSKKKLDVCTSILESRLIVGNKLLYRDLIKNYKKIILKNYSKQFFSSIFIDREKRLIEEGDTRYLLEPNVKSGKGSLRDLQTLEWIGKFLYKINKLGDLISYKILDKNSVNSFIKAKKFFWNVRTHLHTFSGRANEQLNFEYQSFVAKKMGYKKNKSLSHVEMFMKDYFFTAKKVSDLIRIYCSFIEEKEKINYRERKNDNFKEKKINKFIIKNKRIDFINKSLIKNPNNIFQILETAQLKKLEIHPNASNLILSNMNIFKKVANKKKNFLFSFLKILTSKNNKEKILKLMSDLGILGILIPDFKRITGQIQFGGLHTYTVDEHTLKAIGYLNEMELKKNNENKFYNEIFSEIISKRILYISMFFHDLGKGTGKDHSFVSSVIAEKFCSFLEIEKIEKDTIVWLIKNHLLMNKISQKRDIDDNNTIFEFAKNVKSLEQLKLLFIFTIADMKATGKVIWNDWNKFPLEQLFLKTRNLFLGSPIDVNKNIIEKIKFNLLKNKKLKKVINIKNLVKVLPNEIYLNYDQKKIINFLEILNKYVRKTYIKISQNKKKFATEIIVYTKDRPGLLFKLSGAISVSGFNVIEAKASTLKNGMALDILYVRDLNNSMLDSLYHFRGLEEVLYKVLLNKFELSKKINIEKKKYALKNLFNINTKIFVDNITSKKHTILEVNTFDRIGLIYDLTKRLYKQDLVISSAKIITIGKGASQIFYIQDLKGKKIISNKRINKLKVNILSLLNK